ncbi:hypothetical protein EC988_004913, partial [Linderina pennispora]
MRFTLATAFAILAASAAANQAGPVDNDLTLPNDQTGGLIEPLVETADDFNGANQRSRKGGRRRHISDRTKDFLGDLGVELIGTGVETGLNAAIYNKRSVEYDNEYFEEDFEEDDNQRSRK